MKKNSLNEYKVLIIALISSLAITGIGFIDSKIWNVLFAILGVLTYTIVGFLYSFDIISGKQAGRDAYVAVFIILLIIGFYVYNGIVQFQKWLVSWPLWCKILIPSLLIIGIITTIIIIQSKKKRLSL